MFSQLDYLDTRNVVIHSSSSIRPSSRVSDDSDSDSEEKEVKNIENRHRSNVVQSKAPVSNAKDERKDIPVRRSSRSRKSSSSAELASVNEKSNDAAPSNVIVTRSRSRSQSRTRDQLESEEEQSEVENDDGESEHRIVFPLSSEQDEESECECSCGVGDYQ